MKMLKIDQTRCQSCGKVFFCGNWAPVQCATCRLHGSRVTYQFPFAVPASQQAARSITSPKDDEITDDEIDQAIEGANVRCLQQYGKTLNMMIQAGEDEQAAQPVVAPDRQTTGGG